MYCFRVDREEDLVSFVEISWLSRRLHTRPDDLIVDAITPDGPRRCGRVLEPWNLREIDTQRVANRSKCR